jgi:hypothetical protein
MSGNFLAEFIANCVTSGRNTPADMCCAAELRIKEIDNEIKRIEDLRIEKNNLYAVIRQLGGNQPKERKEYKYIDFSIPEDKLADHYRMLCASICELLDSYPNGLLISDIWNAGLGSLEDNEQVYFAIKWLAGRFVIDKDSNMRIIKGKNWENRPHVNN